MRGARSRWLLLVLTTILVTAMLPIGPATGALIADDGKTAQLQAEASRVKTLATAEGITVIVSQLAPDVTGLNFYRSTAQGEDGEKLNEEPVAGDSYLDKTAKTGVQYYYTVKAAQRAPESAGTPKSTLVTPDVIGQAKADIVEKYEAPTAATASSADAKKLAARALPPSMRKSSSKTSSQAVVDSAPATKLAVSKMSVSIGTPAGPTTLPTGGTWTAANSPYFIRGDVIIPAGKTLTIEPGTKVYFDTTVSGEDTDAPVPGVQSVTSKADLIVHGKIVAKGTSTKPILFSSINSLEESVNGGAPLATGGDWGCIFVDSKYASEVSYARFEYATFGVWGYKTCRPYVSNSVFSAIGPVGGENYPYGAVSFINPVPDAASPRVRIVGNKMSAFGGADGINVSWVADGTSTTDRVLDPYIVNNNVTSPYGMEMFIGENVTTAAHKYGNQYLKGTVTGNTIYGNWVVGVSMGAYGQGVGKTASCTTAFSNNTITNYNGVAAVNCNVMSESTGTAQNSPTFVNDKLTGRNSALQLVGNVNSSSGSSTAKVAPSFTNSQIVSSGTTVMLQSVGGAYTSASAAPVFSGGSIESNGGPSVVCLSFTTSGTASCAPSLTNVKGRSWQGPAFLQSIANSGEGKTYSRPRVIGGSIIASGGDGIVATAGSGRASAEAAPYLDNTSIESHEACVRAIADGATDSGNGSGTASGQVLGSMLSSVNTYAYVAQASGRGTGSSTASPKILASSLDAEYDSGLYVWANSEAGAATASPVITMSEVLGYNSALFIRAARNGAPGSSANVTASPQLSEASLVSKEAFGLFIDADNYGSGSCIAKPIAEGVDLVNVYDGDGAYIGVDAVDAGVAEFSPQMLGAYVRGDQGGLRAHVGSTGTATSKANGNYEFCNFFSTWGNALTLLPMSQKAAELKPEISYCMATAPSGQGMRLDAQTSGTSDSAIAAPVISGGGITNAMEGLWVRAFQYGDPVAGRIEAAPKISNFSVTAGKTDGDPMAFQPAILTSAFSSANEGVVYNNSYVYNCPTTGESGIQHDAYSEGGSTGNVYNNAKTLGVSTSKRMNINAFGGRGVAVMTGARLGSAYDRSQSKYLNVASDGTSVYNYTGATLGDGKVSVSTPLISGNAMRCTSGDMMPAVTVQAAAGGAEATSTTSPTISSNSITGPYGMGIDITGLGTARTIKPVISGNTLTEVAGHGIHALTSGASDAFLTITKNTIMRPAGSGMYVSGSAGKVEQNTVVDPGWGYPITDEWNTSCIMWGSANPAEATVRGNLLVGARTAAIVYDGGAATTNYNSFADYAGTTNAPFNYWSSETNAAQIPRFDAKYNWWGTTSGAAIDKMIHVPSYAGANADVVDCGSPLPSCQAKATSITHSHPSSTKVKFTVKFDRPMDRSITKLYFGKSSPYKTYNVTGTWSADGKTFTGTRSKTGLPTGVKLYFSGAKDLPGLPMLSTSKYCKL